jgi:glycosyltransferase involved in cell wall biosynthesis
VPGRAELATPSDYQASAPVDVSDAADVLALLALPPPVHGQSVVSEKIAARLVSDDRIRARIVDIGPGRLSRGPLYHLTRIVRVFGALAEQFKYAGFRSRTLYTVVDSGWGILYNFALIGLARALGFRIVVHHHTAAHTLAIRPAFGRLAAVMGNAGTHVALGAAMAADLRRRYPSVGDVIVLNNAFAVDVCRELGARPVATSQLRIGFLSNLSDEKGLNVVVEAVKLGRRSGLDLVLRLAGPVMSCEASAKIERTKSELGGALEVLGPVAGQAKEDFFNSIDVFLFPTNYKFEAQPLVIIEAMAHGCAIIVNARGYIAELVGDAATVVADDDDFVATMLRLCGAWAKDRARLQHWRELAQERFKELRRASEKDLGRLLGIIARAEVQS